jgi:hypothetical protein
MKFSVPECGTIVDRATVQHQDVNQVKPEEMASHSSEETYHNPAKSSDKSNVNVCSFCQKVHRVHNGPYNEVDAAQSEYKLPSIHFYVAIGAQGTKTRLPPIQPNRQSVVRVHADADSIKTTPDGCPHITH